MARSPSPSPVTPADFLRALDAFAAGAGSLPRLQELLREVLASDPRHAPLLHTLIDRARVAGRLPPAAAAALLRPAADSLTEDLPTIWSEPGAAAERGSSQYPDAGPEPVAAGSHPLPDPGDVLKHRFELVERLGGGAMAAVYRARDRRRVEAGSDAPWVAIKLVPEDGDARAVRALQREALLAARLAHPNIVRVHDLDRADGCVFLTMEWLAGTSLATQLDQRGERPLPRLAALPVIEGICRGLAHAHAEGLVHGDLKPGNVFVGVDGRVKLLDFGSAREAGDDTPPSTALTPAYASPELLAGAPATPADDLFAAACIAYRLLAGTRPFGTGTAAEAAAAGRRPAPIEALSPAQWRALDRALAFRRADRPADVNRFLAELKGPRDDDPAAAAVADGTPGVAAGPRSQVRIALAGIGAVALAGLAVAWLLAGRPPESPAAPAPAPAVADPSVSPDAAATPPDDESVAESLAPAVVPVAAPSGRRSPTPGGRPPATAAVSTADIPATPPRGRTPAVAAPVSDTLERGSVPLTPLSPGSTPVAGPPPGTATLAALEGTTVTGARPGGGSGPALPAATPDAATGALPAVPAGAAEPARAEVAFASLALRRYVEADYPRGPAARGEAGWVDVGFTVDADGRPREVRVVAAEPAGRFDAAALSAVRRWRFAPPPPGTEPRSRVRVRFQP